MNDYGVQVQLALCTLNNFLLDCILGHKTKYTHLLFLPDTVRAVLGLQVSLGVPIAVVQNDDVGGLHVYSQATGSRREHEHKQL